MATTQSKSFKGGAIAAGTGLNGTVLPINTNENGLVTNNGNLLTVTGNNAWAEGERTKATAGRAHAEGYMTEASADDAHAEGSNTISSGTQSHAEGAGTTASEQAAHAEGGSTHATGQYSHSEGYNTQATRLTSHAEGRDTVASHVCSHAEGYSTKASGESSHSEGENTEASGQGSHAEGAACVASGDYSHASGEGTRATDRGSTAVGRFNSDGTALFVVGDGVNPDEGGRDDAFKVDRLGRTYVKNEAGNLVKVRGAGIATFTVTQTDVNTYTYPDESDIRTAISDYDTVILRLAKLGGGFANYILDNQTVAVGVGTKYTWVREDGSRVITLEGSGSPAVWTWTEGDSSLKQDVSTLDTDIGRIGGSIAPAYDPTATYVVGDLVMYARRLYECITKISTPEVWEATHWTRRSVSDFKPFFGALADGGSLTDGVSVEVPNNKLSTLSTSQSSLTLNVTPTTGTVSNFAVEITAIVACTVTVTSTVGRTPTVLKYAAAAGNELEASKTYQLTCVGSCWTLAEFTQPTP